MSTDTSTWVYLIRHGETDANILGRWSGHGIEPLNPLGHLQATLVGKRFAGEGLDILYSSDSVRAVQTAQPIAEATGLEIHTDPRLRETDVGFYQGHTSRQIEAIDPEGLAAFRADPFNARIPGGENYNDQMARVEAAFDEITARHAGARIGIVAHGGSIALVLHVIQYRDEVNRYVELNHTSVTRLRGREGAWEIVEVNNYEHLAGDET